MKFDIWEKMSQNKEKAQFKHWMTHVFLDRSSPLFTFLYHFLKNCFVRADKNFEVSIDSICGVDYTLPPTVASNPRHKDLSSSIFNFIYWKHVHFSYGHFQ